MFKIGTCCQIGTINQKNVFEKIEGTKMGIVLPSHLKKIFEAPVFSETLRTDIMANKLAKVAIDNCWSLLTLLCEVSTWPEEYRFLRVSSNLLPQFDNPEFKHLYRGETIGEIESILSDCRKVIQDNGIRVSTHPGAWCIINTEKQSTRNLALNCLAYHKWFMERLSSPSEGAVINIHPCGELDSIPDIDFYRETGILDWLSFENDDISQKATTEKTLDICEKYGIRCVFDIHHHWCQTDEYLEPTHPLVQRAISTWRGVRPKFHFSQCRYETPANKRERCEHSDMITRSEIKELAKKYLEFGDIMVEAKFKNVASKNLLGD